MLAQYSILLYVILDITLIAFNIAYHCTDTLQYFILVSYQKPNVIFTIGYYVCADYVLKLHNIHYDWLKRAYTVKHKNYFWLCITVFHLHHKLCRLKSNGIMLVSLMKILSLSSFSNDQIHRNSPLMTKQNERLQVLGKLG